MRFAFGITAARYLEIGIGLGQVGYFQGSKDCNLPVKKTTTPKGELLLCHPARIRRVGGFQILETPCFLGLCRKSIEPVHFFKILVDRESFFDQYDIQGAGIAFQLPVEVWYKPKQSDRKFHLVFKWKLDVRVDVDCTCLKFKKK